MKEYIYNLIPTELDLILNSLETSSLEPHKEYIVETTNGEQTILYNYIKKLQKELNQKNKIIDEILNSDFFESDCPFSCDEKNELECCESNCKDDYKSCWLKYFEKRISNGN